MFVEVTPGYWVDMLYIRTIELDPSGDIYISLTGRKGDDILVADSFAKEKIEVFLDQGKV